MRRPIKSDANIRSVDKAWMTKGLWVVVLCTPSAPAQIFSVGVKGGTPLSSSTATGVVGGRGGFGPFALNIRRYTIGPTFEVALPFQLRIEVDALYKRLDTTEHRFFNPSFGRITRLAANTWEFPMLLKRVWLRGPVRPFAVAGGAFRRINSMEGSTEQFTSGFDPPYSLSRYEVDYELTEGGIVVGSGVRLAAWRLQVSPEIRYTRWTALRFQPTQNQVEFLVGVTF
jgi:hypothetical protein